MKRGGHLSHPHPCLPQKPCFRFKFFTIILAGILNSPLKPKQAYCKNKGYLLDNSISLSANPWLTHSLPHPTISIFHFVIYSFSQSVNHSVSYCINQSDSQLLSQTDTQSQRPLCTGLTPFFFLLQQKSWEDLSPSNLQIVNFNDHLLITTCQSHGYTTLAVLGPGNSTWM